MILGITVLICKHQCCAGYNIFEDIQTKALVGETLRKN